MEAFLTRTTESAEDLVLPPPPVPFPVNLLREFISTATTDAQVDLDTVQHSCVWALDCLLEESPRLGSSSNSLPSSDAQLAGALTELLEITYELETYRPSLAHTSTTSPAPYVATSPLTPQQRPFESLAQQLTELRNVMRRRTTPSTLPTNGHHVHPAVSVVREERNWAKMESLTHAILDLIATRDRAPNGDRNGNPGGEDQPPSYTRHDGIIGLDADQVSLPSYHDEPTSSIHPTEETNGTVSIHANGQQFTSPTQEKMLQDLDSVTDAIERLQPRLQDQRSEIRRGMQTSEQLQARMHRDKMRELEEIWDKIERTHGKRRMLGDGQRVDMEEIEAARAARRRRFFESLVAYGENARLEDQDGVMRTVQPTLSQHNSFTSDAVIADDLSELVTMADFFKERRGSVSLNGAPGGPSHHPVTRSRSNSSPTEDAEVKKSQGTFKKIAGMMRRGSLGLGLKGPSTDLDNLTYVAEHQENLRIVQVFIHGIGLSLKDDLVIETSSGGSDSKLSEATIMSKRDPFMTTGITLPTLVVAGQNRTFARQDLYLETKIAAVPTISSAPINSLNTHLAHALSASHLRTLRPKALCCTNCDREIADVTKAIKSEEESEGSGFKDLPSEHWGEMLEVWMCHDDPSFTARLAKQTKDGFWPTRKNVLVGGSYLLVHGDEVKRASLHAKSSHADSWEVLNCACGEVLGKRRTDDGKPGSGTVRFSKWAIALLRTDEEDAESVEPIRYPLSVFVMSDLLELAQAHATYRFIIKDEESDTDQIFVWLFNPSVKISYRLCGPTSPPSPLRPSRSSAKSRRSSSASILSTSNRPNVAKTIRAAKVLYKVINPTDSPTLTNGDGHNAQIEHVSYPSDVVERLMVTLKESNLVYPASRRSMSGYNVGFLERI